MTFEQIVTYIILPGLAGLGALWALVRRLAPEWSKAALEKFRDEREYRQKQDDLEASYRRSETAVAHQLMAELVANSQEEAADVNKYVRENVEKRLEAIERQISFIADIKNDVKGVKIEQGNLRSDFRLLLGIAQELYEEHKRHNQPRRDEAEK